VGVCKGNVNQKLEKRDFPLMVIPVDREVVGGVFGG